MRQSQASDLTDLTLNDQVMTSSLLRLEARHCCSTCIDRNLNLGLMDITGEEGGAPVKTGVALTDVSTGLFAQGTALGSSSWAFYSVIV